MSYQGGMPLRAMPQVGGWVLIGYPGSTVAGPCSTSTRSAAGWGS
jgi:hypothetical protein